jgi:hypothetical protein
MSYSPVNAGGLGWTPPQDELDQWCYLCDSDQYLLVPDDDQEPTSCSEECPDFWRIDDSQTPCTPLCIEPGWGEETFPMPASPPSAPPAPPAPVDPSSGQQAAQRPAPAAAVVEPPPKDSTGLLAAVLVIGTVALVAAAW